MQPEQENQQTDQSTRSTKLPILVIGVLLVATLAAAALLWNHKPSNTQPKEQGAYMVTYSSLDGYTLKGAKSGSRMSFSKPQEYKLIYQSTAEDQASFRQSLDSGQAHPVIGGIDAAEVAQAKPIPASEYTYLASSFSDPTKPPYKPALKPVQDFVDVRLGSIYDVQLTNPKAFTSANVNKNAWIWQLSASVKKQTPPKKSTSSTRAPFDTSKAQPVPKTVAVNPALVGYKGRVVLALGRNTYYYFLIYNTGYNWDNNAPVFNRVLNSLGVDQ